MTRHALVVAALGLLLTACNNHRGQNRHQALAACETEGLRVHANVQNPDDQYHRMGEYALLCMRAKNYDWNHESTHCRTEDSYAAIADEQCYARHEGD